MRKKYWIFILLVVKFSFINSQQIENAEIKLLIKPLPKKIMLRWGVTTPIAWKQANQYGYLLERITISRNGIPVIPSEKKLLGNKPFKPAPLEEWKVPFEENDNTAIIAQALYGESFEAGNLDPIASIMAINRELEQRFIFAMLAAEQSFEAAKLAGWGYEDKEVISGEKYLYKIKIGSPEGESIAKNTSEYTSVDFYENLPNPVDLEVNFEEEKAEINWNYDILKNIYTSYNVEKSEDGTNFKKINRYPIFNAEREKPGKAIYLSYEDSIPNNKKFFYRINGIDSFGEKGPYSKIKSGIARERLKFIPYIKSKKIINDDAAIIQWYFDPKANNLISGFELLRSNTDFDEYQSVIKDIPATVREIKYEKLKRVNYFKIVAIGIHGDRRPSHATIVQPVDSIPPKPPLGLSGTIDTLGIVKLKWTPNKELDLAGYRIYRSNNNKTEFFQVTKSTIRESEFIDTIPVKNLNKKIYYQLTAEDDRYNSSKPSKTLTIEKPDLLPPSPAVITNFKVLKNEVVLKWVPSSSNDIKSHLIFRKKESENSDKWILVAELPINSPNIYKSKITDTGNYNYTIVAKDLSDLESRPCTPISVTIKGQLGEDLISRFNAFVDRENRLIRLNWKTNSPQVSEYLLYKKEGDENFHLYKTFTDQNYFEDRDLKINSIYSYGLRIVLRNGLESQLKKIELKY